MNTIEYHWIPLNMRLEQSIYEDRQLFFLTGLFFGGKKEHKFVVYLTLGNIIIINVMEIKKIEAIAKSRLIFSFSVVTNVDFLKLNLNRWWFCLILQIRWDFVWRMWKYVVYHVVSCAVSWCVPCCINVPMRKWNQVTFDWTLLIIVLRWLG